MGGGCRQGLGTVPFYHVLHWRRKAVRAKANPHIGTISVSTSWPPMHYTYPQSAAT